MILATYTKQPSEIKPYDVDYAPWLATMGEDTLDLIEVAVICITDPSDTALVCADDPPMTTSAVQLWISGGTDGYRYKVTIQATTVLGVLDESELIFKIKDY